MKQRPTRRPIRSTTLNRRRRRGSALFLVLGVVAAAAMMGAVVLSTGDSTATATDRHAERVLLRAAAWSGVQSVMAELAKQRTDLLSGKPPALTAELVLSDEASAEKLVVRLLPWDEAGDDAERREPPLASPEAAKFDLNRATPEMLAALGLSEAAVTEIVARRGARPFASVEELATLVAPLTESTTTRADPAAPSPLNPSQLLTTLSFDPNIQVGLASAEAAGALRFNVAQGWSDELGALITKQLGAEASGAVKRLIEQNKNLATDADFAAALLTGGVPKTLWPVAFDLFTTSDDMYVPGRVDLNLAPEVVLAAIPGIGKEHAAEIVAARPQLSADERRSRVWPLSRDIMKPEDMAKAVSWLTTRSTQWRVRVQASIERSSESGTGSGTKTVRRSATFEAVLDTASERPRLAYLREVTLLPIARAMERRVGALAKAIAEAAPPPLPETPPDDVPPPDPANDSPSGNDSAPEPRRDDEGTKPGSQTPPGNTGGGGVGTMVDRRTGRWNAGSTPPPPPAAPPAPPAGKGRTR